MMSHIYNTYMRVCSAVFVVLALVACDSYLDKLPDDRAEIDTESKVTKLLVSAYPQVSSIVIAELSSDNVDDNGAQYGTSPDLDELYRFKDVSSESFDTPRFFWNSCYMTLATANEALAAIDEMGNPSSLSAQRAEALLCRALNMFQMVNVFCMAYNPDSASVYLGLPYPTKPEEKVGQHYERGTLEATYAQIAADIEAALPYVNDQIYTVPKYHFNQKAAYAFAARFYLYYQKYDKCVEYADKVLGTNPTDYMRNLAPYMTLGYQDFYNRYIQSGENCNLYLMPCYSIAGRILRGSYPRYCHNYSTTCNETYLARAPWNATSGTLSNNLLTIGNQLYGTDRCLFVPKMLETFEFTDKVLQSGRPHIVDTYFTGDETLLCRAEAYALLKDSVHALQDMNVWCRMNLDAASGSMVRTELTMSSVNTFMNRLKYALVTPVEDTDHSIRKVMHPQGSALTAILEDTNTENLIQLILHMRRITTMFQGLRFFDVKRYGIEFTHKVDKENPIVFKAGDLRGAIQLPTDVINAGLEANPR